MKKILLSVLLMVLTVATIVRADSFGSPANATYNKNNGAAVIVPPKGVVALGSYAGSVATLSIPFTADVDMNIGDVVVLTTNTTNGISVSKTTTVGDATQIGVAVFPQGVSWTPAVMGPGRAGIGVTPTVQVAVEGVALAKIAVTVAKGDLLVSSGTAGFLTQSSAATAGSFTFLTKTSIVGMALEPVTVVGGIGYARILVHP